MRKLVLILLGLAILYGLSTVVPFVSPFTRLPFYVAVCNGMPIAATNFMAGFTYTRPGDENYEIHIFITEYFCDEKSAQDAGYRLDTYNP